jgi:hypothetical protein
VFRDRPGFGSGREDKDWIGNGSRGGWDLMVCSGFRGALGVYGHGHWVWIGFGIWVLGILVQDGNCIQ